MYRMMPTWILIILAIGAGAPPTTPPAPPMPEQAPIPDAAPIPDGASAHAVLTITDGTPIPETWPIGRPLILSAARSVAGDGPHSILWSVSPPAELTVIEGGKGAVVSAPPDLPTIEVELIVAKGDALDRIAVSIGIDSSAARPRPGGKPSPPVPPVGPPIRPTPGTPDDDLASGARAYMIGIPAAFRSTAADVRSKKIPTAQALVAAIGQRRVAAGAALSKAMNARLGAMTDPSGAITNPDGAARDLESAAAAMEPRP